MSDVALMAAARDVFNVFVDVAPFVASLGRAANVSPDARRQLLEIEPRMLAALTALKPFIEHQPGPAPDDKLRQALADSDEATAALIRGENGATSPVVFEALARDRAAVRRQAFREAVEIVLGGSFLHDQSPAAKFGQQVAKLLLERAEKDPP